MRTVLNSKCGLDRKVTSPIPTGVPATKSLVSGVKGRGHEFLQPNQFQSRTMLVRDRSRRVYARAYRKRNAAQFPTRTRDAFASGYLIATRCVNPGNALVVDPASRLRPGPLMTTRHSAACLYRARSSTRPLRIGNERGSLAIALK